MELAERSCRACRGDLPVLSEEDIAPLLRQLNGWGRSGGHLVKSFKYKNFAQALSAADRVGALADEQGHHPDLHVSWGKLGVELWTHKVHGLTESDFIIAAKIDKLLG